MLKRLLNPFIALFGLAMLSACASPATPAALLPTATATLPLQPTPAATLTATAPAGVEVAAHCTAVGSLVPTPDATAAALVPPPSASDWAEGPADAAVTLIEYSDFQ